MLECRFLTTLSSQHQASNTTSSPIGYNYCSTMTYWIFKLNFLSQRKHQTRLTQSKQNCCIVWNEILNLFDMVGQIKLVWLICFPKLNMNENEYQSEVFPKVSQKMWKKHTQTITFLFLLSILCGHGRDHYMVEIAPCLWYPSFLLSLRKYLRLSFISGYLRLCFQEKSIVPRYL